MRKVVLVPVVTVDWWEGRSSEQKERLIAGISKAFTDLGIDVGSLHIIIHDIPKTNWGNAGKQASKM